MPKRIGGFKNAYCGPSRYGLIPCNDDKHLSREELLSMTAEEIKNLPTSKVGKYQEMYADDPDFKKEGKDEAIRYLIKEKKGDESMVRFNANRPEPIYVNDGRGGKTRRKGRKGRKTRRRSTRKSRKSRK